MTCWINYTFFIRISDFPSLFLHFYDFEPRIILHLFFNTKGIALLKHICNILKPLLMIYCIKKLSKSLYFASMIQMFI